MLRAIVEELPWTTKLANVAGRPLQEGVCLEHQPVRSVPCQRGTPRLPPSSAPPPSNKSLGMPSTNISAPYCGGRGPRATPLWTDHGASPCSLETAYALAAFTLVFLIVGSLHSAATAPPAHSAHTGGRAFHAVAHAAAPRKGAGGIGAAGPARAWGPHCPHAARRGLRCARRHRISGDFGGAGRGAPPPPPGTRSARPRPPPCRRRGPARRCSGVGGPSGDTAGWVACSPGSWCCRGRGWR